MAPVVAPQRSRPGHALRCAAAHVCATCADRRLYTRHWVCPPVRSLPRAPSRGSPWRKRAPDLFIKKRKGGKWRPRSGKNSGWATLPASYFSSGLRLYSMGEGAVPTKSNARKSARVATSRKVIPLFLFDIMLLALLTSKSSKSCAQTDGKWFHLLRRRSVASHINSLWAAKLVYCLYF